MGKDLEARLGFAEKHPELVKKLDLAWRFFKNHRGKIATGVAVAVASYIAFKTGDDWGTTYTWVEGVIEKEAWEKDHGRYYLELNVQERGSGTGYPDTGFNEGWDEDASAVVGYSIDKSDDHITVGFLEGGEEFDAQYDKGDTVRINSVDKNPGYQALAAHIKYSGPFFYLFAIGMEPLLDRCFSWLDSREEKLKIQKEREKQEKIKEHGIDEIVDPVETGSRLSGVAQYMPNRFSFGRISSSIPTAATAITGLTTLMLAGSGVVDLATGDTSAAMEKFGYATGTGILSLISNKIRKYIQCHSNSTFVEAPQVDLEVAEDLVDSVMKPAGTFISPTAAYKQNAIMAE